MNASLSLTAPAGTSKPSLGPVVLPGYSLAGVRFVPVTIDDAALILQLRASGVRRGFLRAGAATVEEQRAWLVEFIKNAPSTEKYFIICLGEAKLGTIRLSDIDTECNSFAWGSWCLAEGSPSSVAIASCLMAYKIGFNAAAKTLARFEVHAENYSVAAFHRRMGAVVISRDQQFQHFEMMRSSFEKAWRHWEARL